MAVSTDADLTTNKSEGYNHAIRMSIPANANIWYVIKQFRAEDALVTVKLRDAAIGSFS